MTINFLIHNGMEFTYNVIVFCLMSAIRICDFLTFPVYNLLLQPWQQVEKSQRIRATRENLALPDSPYYRIGESAQTFLKDVKTIPEAHRAAMERSNPSSPSLAYREVLNIHSIYDRKACKVLQKFMLSDYQWFSVREVNDMITIIEKAFHKIGVKQDTRVMIFCETRMEWFLCAHAVFRLGATLVTFYSTIGESALIHGLAETQPEVILTSYELIQKLPRSMPESIRTLIYFRHHVGLMEKTVVDFKSPNLTTYNYNKFLQLANSVEELPKVELSEDSVAVLLYTSGSTGKPKGVILTHKNLLSVIRNVCGVIYDDICKFAPDHCWYAYLPLAHVLEFCAESVMFFTGVKIGYGSPYTMSDYSTGIVEGQKGDLRALSPTIMPAVPLVLERIRKQLFEHISRKDGYPSFLKILLPELIAYRDGWIERGFDTPLFNRLVCKKFNQSLGGKMKFLVVGGAPLFAETQRLIRALFDVKVLVGYGSTEIASGCTIMDVDDVTVGWAGAPLFGVKVRLVDWTEGNYTSKDKPYPRGELHVGGNTVSLGYFAQDDVTQENFYTENNIRWYRTGDIVEINELGLIRIIDRKKDLVKLQHGEFVALGSIESALKNCSLIENVCVHAKSSSNFVVALIAPNWKELRQVVLHHEHQALSNEELCRNKEIAERVRNYIVQFCISSTKLAKTDYPGKVCLCSETWTPDNDMLTAALKIKRPTLLRFYAKQVEEMFQV